MDQPGNQSCKEKKTAEEKQNLGALRPPKVSQEVRPIRLRLELVDHPRNKKKMDNRIQQALKTWGNVIYGDTISRDVIVPSDMPLWALNYMIQRCFGWQNSHLHQFELPPEQFKRILRKKSDDEGRLTAGRYMELVGVVFRSPWMEEEEEFWNDDYRSGSIKTWQRKKYTGPYRSLCIGEEIWQCRMDMEELRDQVAYVEVEHDFAGEMECFIDPQPISQKTYEEKRGKTPLMQEKELYERKIQFRQEVYALEDLPMEAFLLLPERSCVSLLERLTVGEILALHGQRIRDELAQDVRIPCCFEDVMDERLREEIKECVQCNSADKQPKLQTLTDTLYYHYDLGDDWYVKLTASAGALDLIEDGRVSQEELEEATLTMLTTHRPVCIAQDGYPVLDDVGGINGYVQFLEEIHQRPFMEPPTEAELWAESMGWKRRRISNQRML